MILETKTDTILLEDGEVQESTNMEIDADSHIFLMRMLSKFYSDGVGSLIRETASNALDSHRSCGVDEPIIVTFKANKDNNYEFSVQDFGCGLDDSDVENIIKKYGKSTKRNDPKALGAFGLGFKSPLAYTSSFYFIGRKGGIERKWMLYESDDESNKIDLLSEATTKERNGVKVIVPVKYGDKGEFFKKIKEQLAYFENVYFDCTDGYDTIKNEDIKIVRSEHFQWSNLISNSNMHICLDNVYYSIDYEKLGIGKISFPVGLRFSLSDGIFPVPNREQLKYTKEAKQVIMSKITQVAEYFVGKYNETIKDGDDVFSVLRYYQTDNREIPHFNGRGVMDVQNLKHYSKTKFTLPKLKGINLLDLKRINSIKDYLLQEYTIKYTLRSGRFLSEKGHWKSTIQYSDISKIDNIYEFSDIAGLKKIYLREIFHSHQSRYFVKKDKTIKLGDIKSRYTGSGYNSYVNLLELMGHPRKEWRERIKECQHIISLLSSKFVDVDKMDIPQDWIDGRKKKRVEQMILKGTNKRRKKLTGEVSGKQAESLERYVSGKNCKFVPTIYQMKDAHKGKKVIIYGNSEDESLFQKLYIVLPKKKISLIIFSERELKNLKEIELHNWMEIGKFMKGKHKIFKRAVTSYLIEKLRGNYNSVFSRVDKLKEISTDLGTKVGKLSDYKKTHYMDDDDLNESMIQVAEEYKLFDTSIYDVYKEVKYILERLPFIEPMFLNMGYQSDNMVKATKDLFKYYKQRIDWQHYNLPINEEKKEPVLEELVEIEDGN